MARAERSAATQMTPGELDSFLESERTLVLVTLRPDGSPVAHAMWFARLGNALYINTQKKSLKSRNVSQDERVCALVETGESYFELRGVRVEGPCVEVTDPDEIARAQAAQAAKDERIGSGVREMPEWFKGSRTRRLGDGGRVVLRIAMERVYSWDFSKVRDHYAPGSHDPREEQSR